MSSPPIVSLTGLSSVGVNQWLRLSDLVTVTTTDGDPISFYRVLDGNPSPTSARGWALGEYASQGGSYQFDGSVAISDVWIQGGSAPGADSLSFLAADKDGFSPTLQVTLSTVRLNNPPVVAANNVPVALNAAVAASSLITVTDADGDSPTIYRFWDPSGGGHFSLGGQTQASGQNIDVAAAGLGTLSYVGGAIAGTEKLWAQVYDGTAWSDWASWNQQTIRTSNTLPTVTAPNRNLTNGQWIRASELGIVVSDADGDAPAQYQFGDGNAATGSAQLWFGGSYLAQGATFTVNADALSNLWLQGGANNATDPFTVKVNDGYGWSDPASFNLVTRAPNRAPVVAANNVAVALNAAVAASSLITVTDADGDSPTIYRFWDPSGGGHFSLGGQTQASGQNIDVAAASVGTLSYVGGAIAGTEKLWAQVYDGAAWSDWASWNQQTIRSSNTVSTVTAPNRNLTNGQWIRASELGIVISDADGDAPAQYQFGDGNAATGSAQLWFGGSYLAQGATFTVNADALSNLWLQGGANNATDPFTVKVNDGYGWSDPASFNLVTRAPNRAPVVAANNVPVALNAAVAASSLITVTDADGDSPTIYRFWDPSGGGHFSLGGQTQASGQNIDVAAASVGTLSYVGGAIAGTEKLWAQVYDGAAWSDWASWNQQTIRSSNTVSTVTAPNRNLTNGQWIRASELGIVISDADGDAPAQYQFGDGNAATGSAQLWFGGSYLAQGATFTVNADALANLWLQGGANNATDPFTVKVNDGYGWSDPASFNLVTRAPNRAPVVAANNVPVALDAAVAASSLITVTDADGDSPTIYRFWDPSGGGHFSLGGQTQASGQNIDVAAAGLGTLSYVGGATAGTEKLWAQVYDGAAWSDWASWNQQTIRSSNTVSTVTAPNRNLTNGQWIRASELGIVVSDADGDAPAQYQFGDGNAATGSAQLWFGGSYLAQGATFTVNADALSNLWLQGGANNATDPFTVKVNDGYGWSDPASFNVVTIPPNRSPVVTTKGLVVHIVQPIDPTTLLSVTDADGDTITRYRFWDNAAGGGTFLLDGVQQAAATTIEVAASQMSRLQYVPGASPGTADGIWAQAFDGTAWSAWAAINTTPYLPIPTSESIGTLGNDTVTGQSFTTYYGAAGNDSYTAANGTAVTVFVGGAGADTYTIPAFGVTNSVTFVFDADPAAGGGDRLNFQGYVIPGSSSAIGIVDNSTLALGDASTNRFVILPDYADPGRGGIDYFSNGSQTWDRAGVQALLTQYSANVETLAWEDLGFNTAEMRKLFTDIYARAGNIDEIARQNTFLALFGPVAAVPTAYAINPLTNGDDTISREDWKDKTIYVGRGGNDTFKENYPNFASVVLMGGSGDDTYGGEGYGNVVIDETGQSANDHVNLFVDDIARLGIIVDGRHLLIRNYDPAGFGGFPSYNGATLIVDWQTPANRIESYTVNIGHVNETPRSTQTYTYDEFAALIDSYNLPRLTWEQVGSSTTAWNQFLTQAQEQETHIAANVPPQVSSTNLVLNGAQKVSLASLINASDANGDLVTRYQLQAPSAALIWRDGFIQPVSALSIDSGALASYQVSSDGSAASLAMSVRAFDGLDWGPTGSITAVVTDPAAPAPSYGFGPIGAAQALGNVGTVASAVYIPRGEAFRLDSIVHPGTPNAPAVTSYEFQAVGDNTGWSQGAYIQRASIIYTSSPTIDFVTDALANNYGPYYLHGRIYTNDSEQWRVRAQTQGSWTDWTNFYVVTQDNTAGYLPADFAPQGGRQIAVQATPTAFDDWAGVGDSDVYNFSVASAGTLRLDFSGLTDSVALNLVQVSNAFTPIAAASTSGAVNKPGASLADLQSGASATFNLAPGDYRFTIQGAGYGSPEGNTSYHLAVTYQ